MNPEARTLQGGYGAEARAEAVHRPWLAGGLGISALALCGLLIASLFSATGTGHPSGLAWGMAGSLLGFLATTTGALPALILRRLSTLAEDVLLGAAAGMMLAASFFSLLAPALAAAQRIEATTALAVAWVVAGLALGALLMLGLDHFIPHEHDKSGPCGPAHERCPRLLLFVFAIALHNLPEGLAVGVGFARADFEVGLPLALAIAVQNIPEGLAVAIALQGAGLSPGWSVSIAAATGLMEPLGALLGFWLTGGFLAAYPLGLALAAGAMIFVVSHEVIPETHRNGHQTPATLGLLAGFALMLVLDQLL
ncbi:MAG: ZIP family metal transporter [Rhodocyclaceae bacterium]|nr:ZIP family metal transporter [Rhodocyclaceae bacterium]